MSIENNWRGSSLDGVPYVGKTTTLRSLRQILPDSETIIVPEYSEIGNLPNFPPADWSDVQKAINQIIDLENRRTDYLNDSLANHPDALVVFDRGPVSCIVFQHVAKQKGYLGSSIEMSEAFTRKFNDGEIILPSGYAHLTFPLEYIELREAQLLAEGHRQNIGFLRRSDVVRSFVTAFDKFIYYLPSSMSVSISTQDKLPYEVAQEVMSFISKQPKNIIATPDFVKFAEDLTIKNKLCLTIHNIQSKL